MATTLYNGQPAPASGWFLDVHGHQLFIRKGDLAPICPRLGPSTVQWRLIREIADIVRKP